MFKDTKDYRKGLLHGSHWRSSMAALGEFVEKAFPDPTQLFEHGLTMLLQHLGVDSAVMTRTTEQGFEAFWWSNADNLGPDPELHQAPDILCARVLEYPGRTLVVRDTWTDPTVQDLSGLRELPIRSFIGAQLLRSGTIIGVLSVQSARPIPFNRAQIGMVNAMADLFSRTLEIESLKSELCMTRDALDLTAAVVEDNALESPATRLPNRHYLEVWLRANIYLARRRGESIAVVRWHLAITREMRLALLMIAESLRGEDLLVDLGENEFLLLLPRTSQEGVEILLSRIRQHLGPLRVGATLWNPLHKIDRDDLKIQKALVRAQLAMKETQLRGSALTYWDILPLNPDDLADITRSW